MTICKICRKWLHYFPINKLKYEKCIKHTFETMGFKSITKKQWLKNQNLNEITNQKA